MNDKRDGSYIIAFTPDTVGELSLTIKVQDRDIKANYFSNSSSSRFCENIVFLTGQSVHSERSSVTTPFGYFPLLHILLEQRIEDGNLCVRE